MLRSVIVVAGKDPLLIDGGSESYLRAYGRAAIRAGYMPHFFSVGTHDVVKETEFGIVHRVRSPFRPFRGLMVAAHQGYVVRAVDRFVGTEKGPHLIHSFGPWGGVGLAVSKRLRQRNIDAIPIITAFGTYNHETRGKLRGLRLTEMPLTWLQHVWELLWTRIAVDPNEGRGYRGSKVVLVNYNSVERIISRQFGNGISFGKMTYASEAAFLKTGAFASDMPEPIARLEPKGAPLLVSISRHDPRKGVDVLLRALAALRKQGTKFRACLIGGGQLLDAHRALVDQLGLASCVAVPGRVPDATHICSTRTCSPCLRSRKAAARFRFWKRCKPAPLRSSPASMACLRTWSTKRARFWSSPATWTRWRRRLAAFSLTRISGLASPPAAISSMGSGSRQTPLAPTCKECTATSDFRRLPSFVGHELKQPPSPERRQTVDQ